MAPAKVLLVLREDFIAHLDDFKTELRAWDRAGKYHLRPLW